MGAPPQNVNLCVTGPPVAAPRKRGRPPTIGKYAERAIKLLNDEMVRAMRLKTEKELAEQLCRVDEGLRKTCEIPPPPDGMKSEDRTSARLRQRALSNLEKVELISRKSKNLRGIFT